MSWWNAVKTSIGDSVGGSHAKTCGFCGNEPASGTRRNSMGTPTKIGTNCKSDFADFPVNKLAEEKKWREQEEEKQRRSKWKGGGGRGNNTSHPNDC